MCTKAEAKEAAHEAIEESLFTPDVRGHTRFGREVHDAVFEDGDTGEPSRFSRELKKAFYQTFGRWFFFGGAAVILAIAGLYYQIQDHEEQLNEGGRYTEADAIEDSRQQENRDQRQDIEIQSVREETSNDLDAINRKLDQLIQRLIP